MIVAVTGASGFVGGEILRELRAAGAKARPVGRGAALREALAGADAVIHLVGIIHERGANTFQAAHVEMTRAVLAAATAAGVRRYLHMSALGTRAGARSRYHQTKWGAEELVRQSGLAWTIFRPSLIYGVQDKAINALATAARRLPAVPVLGDGRSKIQPVAVEQVARCFVAALRCEAAVGQVYELCGPVALTWDELNDQLLAALGRRKPKLHLPMALARPVAAVLEQVLQEPPFTRDQLLMLAEDNTGDPEAARRDLGLVDESFAAGLARMLAK